MLRIEPDQLRRSIVGKIETRRPLMQAPELIRLYPQHRKLIEQLTQLITFHSSDSLLGPNSRCRTRQNLLTRLLAQRQSQEIIQVLF